MSQKLELPDDVYDALTEKARAQGMTPAEWLAKNLCVSDDELNGRPLVEYLDGLTGVIDSSAEPRGDHRPSAYSSAVSEKLARQGLKRP